MNGDICNLPEIKKIADKYNAKIMIDDAHATGVIGKNGGGTAEYFGMEGEIDLVIGTLSKALGALGGFLASSKEVVEYVERLNATFKLRNGSKKWLHRRVCQDFLPARILKRKKRGFAVNVVDAWFKSSFNNKMQGLLLDANSLMFQTLQPKAVQGLLRDHISGKNDNYKILFSLVAFEEWLRSIRIHC